MSLVRSRRVRSRGRWLVAALLTPFAVAAAATVSLAYAIAHAPNGNARLTPPSPPPAALATLGHIEALRLEVGPPRAELSTWVVTPPGELRGTIVLLHGVRLEKRSMLPYASALAKHGYRTLLVDLRGHGASTGEYLTYGQFESRDVSQVLDALSRRGTDLGPVGVQGFSYGAATALHLAGTDSRVRAVVAVAAFSSLRGVVRDYVRWQAPHLEPVVPNAWLDTGVDLGARWAGFDPDAASPAAAASTSRAALLLLHGTDDRQVSPDHAWAIERAAGGRAHVQLLAGQTHESALADGNGTIRDSAIAWFDQHLAD